MARKANGWEHKLGQLLHQQRFFQIKTDLCYKSVSLPGTYPKEMKSEHQAETYALMSIRHCSYILKPRKQCRDLLLKTWLRKAWQVYTMEYYLALRGTEILSFWRALCYVKEVIYRRTNVLVLICLGLTKSQSEVAIGGWEGLRSGLEGITRT